jgi:hypothetical protein
MSGKKILFLFLALLLPICIFLFLRIFGKNEFDVPALYQDNTAEFPVGCSIKYTAPYLLPDSVMNKFNSNGHTSFYLLNFSDMPIVDERVSEEAKEEAVTILHAQDLKISSDNMKFFKECILLMKPPFNVALIDNERKIRGYYKGSNREDTDRLIVELKILLKKY